MELLLNLLALLAPFMLIGTTYYGVNKTKARLGTSSGSNILDPGVFKGKVRCMIDTYVIVAGNLADDIIEMGGVLPKGSRVLDVTLYNNASVSASSDIDVGDYEDPNRYMDALDLSSATPARSVMDELVTGPDYKVDESVAATLDSQIIVTLIDVTTPVAGTILILVVLYTQE